MMNNGIIGVRNGEITILSDVSRLPEKAQNLGKIPHVKDGHYIVQTFVPKEEVLFKRLKSHANYAFDDLMILLLADKSYTTYGEGTHAPVALVA